MCLDAPQPAPKYRIVQRNHYEYVIERRFLFFWWRRVWSVSSRERAEYFIAGATAPVVYYDRYGNRL
ncbi:hypothetical protein RSgd_1482 [Ralstonia solanacearum]